MNNFGFGGTVETRLNVLVLLLDLLSGGADIGEPVGAAGVR